MPWALLPGRRLPHGAADTLVGHPVADTILRVPQAVVIGAAMRAMVMPAGVVAQPAGMAGAVMATGEPLLPAADTTIPLAAAAVAIIITRLLRPAAVIGPRAALRAAGTRIQAESNQLAKS
jgi:hypothetical protein